MSELLHSGGDGHKRRMSFESMDFCKLQDDDDPMHDCVACSNPILSESQFNDPCQFVGDARKAEETDGITQTCNLRLTDKAGIKRESV
jgi:hypothetical protein